MTTRPPNSDSRQPGLSGWDNAEHGPNVTGNATMDDPTWPVDLFPADLNRNTHETTPSMMDDEYWDLYPATLTTADLAKILRVGKPAMFRRLTSGLIPGHLVVGSWIIFKDEVRAWLESTSNQAPPGPPAAVDVLAAYPDELSYQDLMVLFGKAKQTIYIWLRSGEIPAYNAGNRWIIHKTQLRQLLRETSNQNVAESNSPDTPEQKR